MLIGAVLLWRALCASAFADTVDVPDPRFRAEWSSPGLNRCVKLTFATHHWDTEVPPVAPIEAISDSLDLE